MHQVVDDMPAGKLTKHDVPVDIIVTPTKIIRVPERVPKPAGVFWDLLSPQKLAQIKVRHAALPCLTSYCRQQHPQPPLTTIRNHHPRSPLTTTPVTTVPL